MHGDCPNLEEDAVGRALACNVSKRADRHIEIPDRALVAISFGSSLWFVPHILQVVHPAMDDHSIRPASLPILSHR